MWLPPGSGKLVTWDVPRSAAGEIRATASLPWSATHTSPLVARARCPGCEKDGPTARLAFCTSRVRSTKVPAWSPWPGSPISRAKADGGTVSVYDCVAPGPMVPGEDGTAATPKVPQARAPKVGCRLVRAWTETSWANLSAFVTDMWRGAPGVRNRLRLET